VQKQRGQRACCAFASCVCVFECVCVVSCSAGRRTDGDLWVLAIDGMDQAKTRLPHEMRTSKDTDSSEGLPLHIVSVVVYGAFVPIIGLINDPSVTKNSCLTVTNIHRAIELQWTASVEASASKKIVRWPSRLHITFDNAVGENINSNVFYYLAALVHHGVFKRVTVGTLCVGHTHNINDQIFSVWSKYLNVNDVMTLKSLMEKFSTNYKATMIDSKEEMELLNQLEIEKKRVIEEESEKDSAIIAGLKNVTQKQQVARVWKKYQELERLLHRSRQGSTRMFGDIEDLVKQPHMEMVERNADVGSWLKQPTLKGLSKYHVFAIDRDTNGDTFLARKFLSGSDITYKNDLAQAHNFEVEGVMYRDQQILFRRIDRITADPLALPYNVVDTDSIMEKVRKMHNPKRSAAMNKLNTVDAQTYIDMCASFHDKVKKQGEECEMCGTQIEKQSKIGVIHRLQRNASEAEKTAYATKNKAKEESKTLLKLHFSEADAAERHPSKVMHGWWTNWLTRVDMIAEHYISKGVPCLQPGGQEETGFYAPPTDSTVEERNAFERVEVRQMAKYGPPRYDDFALIRSSREEQQAPFWVARVLLYDTPSAEDLEADAERARSHKRYRKTDIPAVDSHKRDVNVAEWYLEQSVEKTVNRGKDGAQIFAPGDNADTFKHTHIKVEWWIHDAGRNKTESKSGAADKQVDPNIPASAKPAKSDNRSKRSNAQKSKGDAKKADAKSAPSAPSRMDVDDDAALSTVQVDRLHLSRSAKKYTSMMDSPPSKDHAEDAEYREVDENDAASESDDSSDEIDMTRQFPQSSAPSASVSRINATAKIEDSRIKASCASGAVIDTSAPPLQSSPINESDIEAFRDNVYFADPDRYEARQWVHVSQLIHWGDRSSVMKGFPSQRAKDKTKTPQVNNDAWQVLLIDLKQGEGGIEGAAALRLRFPKLEFHSITHNALASRHACESLAHRMQMQGLPMTQEQKALYAKQCSEKMQEMQQNMLDTSVIAYRLLK
jgi:hypothetical protein